MPIYANPAIAFISLEVRVPTVWAPKGKFVIVKAALLTKVSNDFAVFILFQIPNLPSQSLFVQPLRFFERQVVLQYQIAEHSILCNGVGTCVPFLVSIHQDTSRGLKG